MPKFVAEIAPGREFQFTGKPGELAMSSNRIFRIIRNDPTENINIPVACGVYIGDRHPALPGLFCTNFSAQTEGDGRMVILATFNYEIQSPVSGTDGSQVGDDGAGSSPGRLEEPPPLRPANWSVSSAMMEVPAYSWQEVTSQDGATGNPEPAANPAGDMYDGVTRLEPVVTISVEQFEFTDPTRHVLHVGKTNLNVINLGTLNCPRRTVMLRSVQSRAATEQFGPSTYRGWNVSYEFAFRRNSVEALSFGDDHDWRSDVGWDIAVPQSGINVKAFNPAGAGADKDPYGQPLKHTEYKIQEPLALPDGVAAGEKVRGMIRVHEYEKGGVSQSPCGQPIPLNDDGTPRSSTANPKVIVRRYCVTEEIDFKAVLNLRLN